MAEPIQVGAPVRNSQRRVFIMLGVAVALFLALRVLPGLLFSGGDDGGEVDDVTLPPARAGAQPIAPVTGDVVPETVARFSDKNPFVPLVTAAVSTDDGASTVAPPPDFPLVDPLAPAPGETFDPGSEVTPEPGTTAPPAEGGSSTPPSTAPPRQPDRVALLELYVTPDGAEVASVRVNDTLYQVRAGEDFAGRYRVTSMDMRNRCAQLLFGDERFSLCEGDEALK